jgi:hypothetical protein
VAASGLDNLILNSLDDTEALLDWSEIENLLSSICTPPGSVIWNNQTPISRSADLE